MIFIKENNFLRKLKSYVPANISLKSFVLNTSISTRLIVSLLITSLLPVFLVGILSFISSYKDMELKSKDFSQKISTQISNNINYVLGNYVDKFERISSNNVILHELYNLEPNSIASYSPVEIKQTLASIVGAGIGINSIEICSKLGARLYYSLPISKGGTLESKLITNTYKSNDIIWDISRKEIEDDKNTYIILSKKMRVEPSKEEIIGYCFMAIKRDYIDEICRNNTLGSQHYIIITDKNGLIISHPDQNKVATKLDRIILDRISNSEQRLEGINPEKIFKINTDEGTLLVSYEILKLNGWKVITIVPYSYLMKSTVVKGIFTLGIALLCMIISLFISITVTNSISSPVKKLAYSMNKVGRGDLDAKIEDGDILHSSNDELINLESGFNDMLSKFRNLIDDVYRSKIKEKELMFLKKEAELNALQQQINPHFLYNTLESIFWTAQLKGDDEISEMVTALGNFFRTSINKGLEYITVEDEIKNIQNYVYLQRIRFSDRFSVNLEVSDEILSYKIIKLILQPIIENAIVHGLENLENGGLIIVKGYKNDNNIILEVIDNGIGMSQDEVESLETYISNPQKDTSRSVGVKNVNQRIKLYFGDEYGVKISSNIGKGTEVCLTLPALINELEITLKSI